MTKLFLFKNKKKRNDQDVVAYIERPSFKGNYFGRITLDGACYSRGFDKTDKYEDLTTVLTKSEFKRLVNTSHDLEELGYQIKYGDPYYIRGMELIGSLNDIFDKLESTENQEVFDKVVKEEKESLKKDYEFTDDDIELIFDDYPLEYQDASIVCRVFDDVKECGYEEAEAFVVIPNNLKNYIDYERFGQDLINDGDSYLELQDGRVVCYAQ